MLLGIARALLSLKKRSQCISGPFGKAQSAKPDNLDLMFDRIDVRRVAVDEALNTVRCKLQVLKTFIRSACKEETSQFRFGQRMFGGNLCVVRKTAPHDTKHVLGLPQKARRFLELLNRI